MLLCTVRDEISYPVNCPCLPFLLDLQNEVKEIKANSSRQLQPNPSTNCELTKLLEENNENDLAREVENASESEVVLSELTARNDDYSDAVKDQIS